MGTCSQASEIKKKRQQLSSHRALLCQLPFCCTSLASLFFSCSYLEPDCIYCHFHSVKVFVFHWFHCKSLPDLFWLLFLSIFPQKALQLFSLSLILVFLFFSRSLLSIYQNPFLHSACLCDFPLFVNKCLLELYFSSFSATSKCPLTSPHSSNPAIQAYLLAQPLGHIVHSLVGFLVHHCCYWL